MKRFAAVTALAGVLLPVPARDAFRPPASMRGNIDGALVMIGAISNFAKTSRKKGNA